MRTEGITQLVSTIVEHDAATLDRREIDQRLGVIRRVQGWLDAEVHACTRRLHQLATPVDSDADAGSGVDWGAEVAMALIDHAGRSNAEANATKERTDLCDRNQELEDSLATGELTASHLDAIAKARRRLTTDIERLDFDSQMDTVRGWAIGNSVGYLEARLRPFVNSIRHQHRGLTEAEELAKQRNDSELKDIVDHLTGMHKFIITADPVRAAKIRSAYRAELAALKNDKHVTRESWGSLQVEAFVNAMSGGQAAARSSEVVVIIDHQTLTTGQVTETSVHETVDGTQLPVSFIKQLCCDALITFAAIDERGVIHNTIEQRTANREQRRALAAMYRTCAFPDCTTPIADTRAHHVTFRRNQGPTKLDNLLPVCERHHHAIHDNGWHVTLDPTTRQATFTDPTGVTYRTRPNRTNNNTGGPGDAARSASCERPNRPGRSKPADDVDADNSVCIGRAKPPSDANTASGFTQPRLC